MARGVGVKARGLGKAFDADGLSDLSEGLKKSPARACDHVGGTRIWAFAERHDAPQGMLYPRGDLRHVSFVPHFSRNELLASKKPLLFRQDTHRALSTRTTANGG